MTKRVAFVDIDGCLLKNGKLNPTVVKKLQDGKYDEIVLFTQRSKFIQILQHKELGMQLIEDPTKILFTHDVVDELSKVLNRPVKVSTSVDHYFHKPGDYYDRGLENEMGLKEFEIKLKSRILEQGEEGLLKNNFLPEELEKSYLGEQERIKKLKLEEIGREVDLKVRKKMGPEVDESVVKAAIEQELEKLLATVYQTDDKFYPQKKVEQYVNLAGALPMLLRAEPEEQISVDVFDDAVRNLTEIMAHQDLPIVPNCFVVHEERMCTLSDYTSKKPEDIDNPEEAMSRVYAVNKLQAYKQTLPAHLHHRLTFLNSKTIEEISAVDKAIQILSIGKDAGIKLSDKDLKVLHKQQIKDLLGDLSSKIDEYNSGHPASFTH